MFEKVTEIVAKQLGAEKESITMESAFIEDLGADSLDMVELVMAFEEELGVKIADEDAEKIRTVGDAVNYVQTRL